MTIAFQCPVERCTKVEQVSPRTHDLAGRRFGFLTVISHYGYYTPPCGHKTHLWLCECDCGCQKVMLASYLQQRTKVQSCGCHVGSKTHGMTNTPTYGCWRSMIRRCCDPHAAGYDRYGGVGVRVCGRWRSSFENFLDDMGHRPSVAHSLDRYPDNTGDYEPGNVRWATMTEQNNNTSSNHRLAYNGTTMTISEWARRIGLKTTTLWERINSGWAVDRALTEPKHSCGPKGKRNE